MASVNGNDFLTAPTGSCRFLPFEVLSIDIQKALSLDMDNVFAEIMWLYENGMHYWFDENEIDELHNVSKQFHVQTVEYELLMQGFEKPAESDKESFMTTSQVLHYLRANCSLQLSEKRVGEALRKAGFKRAERRINNSPSPFYGYRIAKIVPNPFIS